jgi:hypothetical protein
MLTTRTRKKVVWASRARGAPCAPPCGAPRLDVAPALAPSRPRRAPAAPLPHCPARLDPGTPPHGWMPPRPSRLAVVLKSDAQWWNQFLEFFLNYLTLISNSTNKITCSLIITDPILLLWSQSLDAKLLKNNFRKQLNDVVSNFTPVTSAAINFWSSLKIN